MFDACICVDVDEDRPSAFSQNVVNALKLHVCDECHGAIYEDDDYELVLGKWNGMWSTYRTCMICRRVRDDLFECGWIFGEVWERIHETFCDYDEDECVCPESLQ